MTDRAAAGGAAPTAEALVLVNGACSVGHPYTPEPTARTPPLPPLPSPPRAQPGLCPAAVYHLFVSVCSNAANDHGAHSGCSLGGDVGRRRSRSRLGGGGGDGRGGSPARSVGCGRGWRRAGARRRRPRRAGLLTKPTDPPGPSFGRNRAWTRAQRHGNPHVWYPRARFPGSMPCSTSQSSTQEVQSTSCAPVHEERTGASARPKPYGRKARTSFSAATTRVQCAKQRGVRGAPAAVRILVILNQELSFRAE